MIMMNYSIMYSRLLFGGTRLQNEKTQISNSLRLLLESGDICWWPIPVLCLSEKCIDVLFDDVIKEPLCQVGVH